LLEKVFGKDAESGTPWRVWSWGVSPDGRLIDMKGLVGIRPLSGDTSRVSSEAPKELESFERGIGLSNLLEKLSGKRVRSLDMGGGWFLEVLEGGEAEKSVAGAGVTRETVHRAAESVEESERREKLNLGDIVKISERSVRFPGRVGEIRTIARTKGGRCRVVFGPSETDWFPIEELELERSGVGAEELEARVAPSAIVSKTPEREAGIVPRNFRDLSGNWFESDGRESAGGYRVGERLTPLDVTREILEVERAREIAIAGFTKIDKNDYAIIEINGRECIVEQLDKIPHRFMRESDSAAAKAARLAKESAAESGDKPVPGIAGRIKKFFSHEKAPEPRFMVGLEGERIELTGEKEFAGWRVGDRVRPSSEFKHELRREVLDARDIRVVGFTRIYREVKDVVFQLDGGGCVAATPIRAKELFISTGQ
jgi:hypothetical protein